MIIKRNFNPIKVWQYIKKPMWFVMVWSLIIWLVHFFIPAIQLQFSFVPIGVLGTALAIFVAFRNNSAYGRWWEAAQIWYGIVTSSRILARLIITFTDSHSHQDNYEKERSEAFKNEMILRCIAWVHALRLHLRAQEHWEEVKSFLPENEYQTLVSKQNKPAYLQLQIGGEIYKAMANGTLGGFDSFQMEGQMLALSNYQAAAEKIKNMPLPRQYDFFTRLFVILFALLLPFGILSFFQSEHLSDFTWLMVPLTIIIAGVFVIMERTGAANENPFENLVTDIPMAALCNTIERDLLEMLDVVPLPKKLEAEKGYLY